MSDKILVTINDEVRNRSIQLFLSNSEYERASKDSYFVSQLIKDYDNKNKTTPEESVIENNDAQQDIQPTEQHLNNSENTEANSLYIWSDSCIQLLLSLYEESKEDFGTKRQKKIFEDVANKMKQTNPAYTMSGGQCHSKLNGLKKTYKKILDHNSKSGNDRVTWPYFDRMNEIFGSTGWANPAATASEAGPSSTSDSSTPISSEPKKKKKLDDLLEDFFKEKKKNMNEKLVFKKEKMERMIKLKQQQHQEKMEVLKSFCNQYKK